MQRTIKFRGKRVDNGEWVYGYYVFKKEYNKQFILEYIIGSEIDYTIEREVDPATVGQFTGLTDKNGKEIYEGDIITGWTKAKEVVKYDELNARFSPIWFQYWDNDKRDKQMEVIGNIHENRELCRG